MLRKILVGAVATSAMCLVPMMAIGQSTFGSITGTVTDPSGAMVPSAQIQVTNEGSGVVRRVSTSAVGVFNVPDLGIGTYRIRVTASGFTTYERGDLHLSANQILNLNVQLKVGSTSTVVQVQGASPVINTEATDISGSIGHQAIEALPLVSRHYGDGGFYSYTLFNTGVASVSTSSIPAVGGARTETGTLPTMDGIAVMAYFQGASPVQPSLENVEEVKVETAVAPAEFATAANFQVISKPGTNQFHGGAFWDYNGSALNARNFFGSKVPFRVYNDFGASLGGPIKKNKLFFFFDYEGSREAANTVLTEDVPLPAWKNGDFSGLSTPIIDPKTGTQFPNNQIPASRISQVSQNIQNYIFPSPNTGGPGALFNNWSQQYPGTTGFTRYNQFDGRGDYNISERDTVFARISWKRMPLDYTDVYPYHVTQLRYGESAVFSWTHTISPTAFNEFRFGGTYHRNYYASDVIGSTLLQQFGIQGISTAGIHNAPAFDITGITAVDLDQTDDSYENNPETTLEWIDNLSWNRGRHFMKFGFDAVRDRLNGNQISSDIYGIYNFSGIYTGLGYADFLLGIPETTQVGIPSPEWDFRGTTYGIYGQDQYRVNSRLTLNYGVRWELEGPYHSKSGSIYNFDPKTGALVVPNSGANHINPFYPSNIPITTASQAGYPADTLLSFNKNTIEPRVGFAYKMFSGNKTVVIRGGYGIYGNLIYAPIIRGALSGGPFSGNVTYINAVNNGTPLFSFPSPFLSTGTTSTQNVNGVNPNLKIPYTQQWHLSLEHQIGQIGLRVSYLGSRSDQLVYRRNLNEPAPSTASYSTKVLPYPTYRQVIYADSGGNEFYNALQMSAERKYGRNLIFNAGWTWAKDLTDTQDAGGGGGTFGGQVIQDQFNRAVEKANNGVTVPHRFYGYVLYTLPFGQGQRFLSGALGPMQQVLGGWRTTWTVTRQSGGWFTPSFSGFDPSNTSTFGGRPDRIANGNISSGDRGPNHWFDPSAFAIPGCPASQPVCSSPVNVGRFGTSGLNILSGPPMTDVDFALDKTFKIGEHVGLQFITTMADAFNHPFFSNPRANISSTHSVATISGTAHPLLRQPNSREIDFGLRLMF
ncbi:MAG TPA: TonB-dependent receptor [Terriglobia bacterium]|nr:TonB-dependent receptor [Terriglobia bacterium]